MKGINEQCTETGSSTEFYYYLDIIMLDPVKCVIVSADGFIKKILVLTYQQLTIKNDV